LPPFRAFAAGVDFSQPPIPFAPGRFVIERNVSVEQSAELGGLSIGSSITLARAGRSLCRGADSRRCRAGFLAFA
jgi:hypothetical protein